MKPLLILLFLIPLSFGLLFYLSVLLGFSFLFLPLLLITALLFLRPGKISGFLGDIGSKLRKGKGGGEFSKMKANKNQTTFVELAGAFGRAIGKFNKKVLTPVTDEAAEIYDDLKNNFAPTASDFYNNVLPEKIKSVEEIYASLKKQHGPQAAKLFKKSYKSLPKATTKEKVSTIVGGASGTAIGFAIGGSIGVVGFFGGVGISLPMLLGVTLAFAGNRIGVGLDKAELEERQREQDDRFNELLEKYYEEKERVEETQKPIEVSRLYGAANHAEQLKRALRNAKESIIILCGWVTDYVIDDEFKGLLKGALERGVNVYIGYGYVAANEAKPRNAAQKRAEDYLYKDLLPWCVEQDPKGILKVVKHPNHAKILIRDEEYAVCGSFNWLSNAGRSKNIDYSWKIKDKEFVKAEKEIILNDLLSRYDRRDFLKTIFPWNRH